jgi:hypothetical protein
LSSAKTRRCAALPWPYCVAHDFAVITAGTADNDLDALIRVHHVNVSIPNALIVKRRSARESEMYKCEIRRGRHMRLGACARHLRTTRRDAMRKVINKILVTAVCAAMAFPTVSPAQEHGHGAHPPPHQQGGGQHYDHGNGGQGHYNGYHGNGGPYPYYGGHDQHHYYNYGAYRPYYYGGYQPYYGYGNPYYYGHHHGDGNDDALWAIGGLVVGAIIGGAVEHAKEHPPATTPAPPPAAQPQRNCDHVEYDANGNPYVDRTCPL